MAQWIVNIENPEGDRIFKNIGGDNNFEDEKDVISIRITLTPTRIM